MPSKIDYSIIGQRFGRLTVVDFDHMGSYHKSYWLCRCDCGNSTVVPRLNLVTGTSTSCGCNRAIRAKECKTTHGMSRTPLHGIWCHIRQRCRNENDHAYPYYGARGIDVCDEWDEFENFYDWAINNGYEAGLSIDRKNNNEGYNPENCRWADRITQCNNRRTSRYITYNDITHTMAEWSRLLNVNYDIFKKRMNRGDMQDFKRYYGYSEED